ncbi:STAS-like domain-containing protein [Bisgaard Taxon 45]|uniref:STAS-like domain-containing protein n=1 Tax=Bisgaard Taxon 45 TaxID=304289 RepID=A0ABT9KE65_9PAST|nr:STAS-like domain-containing protein [Bisgaard Taxon 45]
MTMNKIIVIKELLGGVIALSMDKGIILHEKLVENLNQGFNLILDFSDVKVASPFLNASIGALFKDFTADEINNKITFINTSPSTEQTLSAVKRNAERYFSNSQEAEFTDKLVENVIKEV